MNPANIFYFMNKLITVENLALVPLTVFIELTVCCTIEDVSVLDFCPRKTAFIVIFDMITLQSPIMGITDIMTRLRSHP